ILGDDLHVVRVGGKRFVFHEGLPNLLSDVPVRAIFLLLIGGELVLFPIPFVDLGIVNCWSCLLRSWFLCQCERPTAEQQTGTQKGTKSSSTKHLHLLTPLIDN